MAMSRSWGTSRGGSHLRAWSGEPGRRRPRRRHRGRFAELDAVARDRVGRDAVAGAVTERFTDVDRCHDDATVILAALTVLPVTWLSWAGVEAGTGRSRPDGCRRHRRRCQGGYRWRRGRSCWPLIVVPLLLRIPTLGPLVCCSGSGCRRSVAAPLDAPPIMWLAERGRP